MTQGFDDYGIYQGTQVIYDMPAKTYHADADGPRLSQSLATLCVQRSPLHAWAAHPLLGAHDWKYFPGEDDGTIVHSLLLEPNGGQIVEVDDSTFKTKSGKPSAGGWRTEEAKELRASIVADGKIPILTNELGAFKYKTTALTQRLESHPRTPVVLNGASEVVIYWTEETPSGPVRCRCRIDHLSGLGGPGLIITDLKTCGSAAPRDLRSVAWNMGYDIQAAAYRRAVAAAFPEYVGRVEVVFAFLELDKPYAVNPVTLNGEFMRLGDARWERGRDLWAAALRDDNWTGFAGGALEPPAWATADDLGAEL